MVSSTARIRGSCRSVQISWVSISWLVVSSTAAGSPSSATLAMPADVIGTEKAEVKPSGK